MALIVAGERSGVGKTTVVLLLLATLRQKQLTTQPFKVGPDYIDPMFHTYVTGRACRNLDPILTSEPYVQQCFAHHSQDADCSLIEGVMGLFDGASGTEDIASTAHIARVLDVPILLVLDCARLSGSVAAIAHGYQTFDPRLQLAGVVLNRVGSDRHLELLKSALSPLNIPILGVLHRLDDITIPDRHLGLVPTAELPTLDALIRRLADLGEARFDWSRLLPLLRSKGGGGKQEKGRESQEIQVFLHPGSSVSRPKSLRIAVARDRAFSFYYADNLELLETLGAELVDWSPLTDTQLPESVCGLYVGGGFPEVFAAELAANQVAQQAVRSAIQLGMPTYAECGGLMYLCKQIVDFDGHRHSMVGILPTTTRMESRLTLGYRRAVALQDSPLLLMGEAVWGHEFHRSGLDHPSAAPLYEIQGYHPDSPIHQEGWCLHQVHASYIHLHWGACPSIPSRFLAHCATFKQHLIKTSERL